MTPEDTIREKSALLADWADGAHPVTVDDVRADLIAALDALAAERDSLMADTWRAFVESGGDPDGNLGWNCDAVMAGTSLVDAVRSLRADYDACPSPEDLQAVVAERDALAARLASSVDDDDRATRLRIAHREIEEAVA